MDSPAPEKGDRERGHRPYIVCFRAPKAKTWQTLFISCSYPFACVESLFRTLLRPLVQSLSWEAWNKWLRKRSPTGRFSITCCALPFCGSPFPRACSVGPAAKPTCAIQSSQTPCALPRANVWSELFVCCCRHHDSQGIGSGTLFCLTRRSL